MNRAERIEIPPRAGNASPFSGAAVRCERAGAELRAGRPVIVESGGARLAVLALDAVAPETYRAFARLAGDRHELFLTVSRARALGLDTMKGVLVPLAGLGYDRAAELGYTLDAEAPQAWTAATTLHQEAAGLARLALLLPALVVSETAAASKELSGSLAVSVGDLAEAYGDAGQLFEIVARTAVPLQGIEAAEFVVFRGGLAQRDQVAIVVGDPDARTAVPVRVHSSCLTGDLFGSLKCDCGDQLRRSLRTMQERGGGVLLYLDQEGRGTGIASKMRAYGFQCEGLDTVDADAELGFGTDERRYEAAIAMLQALGYTRVELLTNNPTKIAHLRAGGIDVVGRAPAIAEVTAENRNYLKTKVARAGHMIDVDALPTK